MTEDEAMLALGHLVGGLNGFVDANVDEYMTQFMKLEDAEALDEVCVDLCLTWTSRWKPTVADVVTRYHQFPRVRLAREARVAAAMLDESTASPVLTVAEGWAIAGDAYRSAYGRDIGEAPVPNPEYAETLILNCKRRDRNGDWHARYIDVLRGFNQDQARCGASLDAIGRRLTNTRGNLVLRPPEPPSEPPQPPTRRSGLGSAATPPPPPERTTDASGLLSEAIGATIKRMEGP